MSPVPLVYLGEERQQVEKSFFSKETLRWQLALNSDLKNTKFEVLTFGHGHVSFVLSLFSINKHVPVDVH